MQTKLSVISTMNTDPALEPTADNERMFGIFSKLNDSLI